VRQSEGVCFEEVVAFHGHRCPELAIGYRMARSAIAALTGGFAVSSDEPLVAIVENDACAVDALQIVTGCTCGKGNLILRDHGKHVMTLMSQRSGRAVRVCYHGQGIPGTACNDQDAKIGRILSATDDDILTIQPSNEVPPFRMACTRESAACTRRDDREVDPRGPSVAGRTSCIPCLDGTQTISHHASDESIGVPIDSTSGQRDDTFGGPATLRSLENDFRALGIRPGMTLLVHSSLSSLGWVCGGAMAVVLALESVLGAEGTLVMPTHSYAWSDPAGWRNPAVPKGWAELCRNEMPAFDPAWTPTSEMGAIPETFRGQPGVVRSGHPVVSFAAWGRHAAWITDDQSMDFAQGEGSPLARIYDLNGWVLLLGVGHGCNTSLHLAEYRACLGQTVHESSSPVLRNGACTWIRYCDIDYSDDDFEAIGEAFSARTESVTKGRVCLASALLLPQRSLVDFAVPWMEAHRPLLQQGPCRLEGSRCRSRKQQPGSAETTQREEEKKPVGNSQRTENAAKYRCEPEALQPREEGVSKEHQHERKDHRRHEEDAHERLRRSLNRLRPEGDQDSGGTDHPPYQ